MQPPTDVGGLALRTIEAVAVHEEVLRREAEAGVEPAAVEEQQAGAGAGVGVDLDFDLVGLIAVDEPQRRRVGGCRAFRLQHQRAVLVAIALAIGRGSPL